MFCEFDFHFVFLLKRILLHLGKQLSTNINASSDNVQTSQQQFDSRGFLHVSQVINTVVPITTYSAKDPQRISIPSDSTYNQNYAHAHPFHQFKPELFAENINYNGKRENTQATVLAYSMNRQIHYNDKFENYDFSISSNQNASHFDDDQKDGGHSKHRKRERNENFDSFMETENENDPNSLT